MQEHKGEAFLKVNPFGKLPALQDGDVTLVCWERCDRAPSCSPARPASARRGPPLPLAALKPLIPHLVQFESGAMLAYLADKYGGADTPEKRGDISKWVLFANATLVRRAMCRRWPAPQPPAPPPPPPLAPVCVSSDAAIAHTNLAS